MLILCRKYINNSLHLARKYARIFVRGHYLFREANSFPRAKLEENCVVLLLLLLLILLLLLLMLFILYFPDQSIPLCSARDIILCVEPKYGKSDDLKNS